MKKIIQVEATICDICGSNGISTNCMECGKDICLECGEERAVEYSSFVYGICNEGFYCKECDAKLTKSRKSPLHNAYRAIASLRLEYNAWQHEFDARAKAAEAKLKALQRSNK